MKNWRTEIKWGLLFVLAGLAWTWLEKLAGLHSTRIDQHASLTMLFMIPAFALYWLAFREKKRQLGGQISFRQAFLSGLVISVVVTVLTPLSQYLTHYFISPDYLRNITDYSVRTGAMTAEEASGYFTFKNYVIQSLLFAPVAGIITSLLVGWLVSRGKSGQA
ncbi:MAG: DUF4199 domain-containing protein [Chitinophagaceae bacterium]|jgi:hypothetical protein|nr:DUF4199 domain-containing protein [Chitinophagaceae bacterium]